MTYSQINHAKAWGISRRSLNLKPSVNANMGRKCRRYRPIPIAKSIQGCTPYARFTENFNVTSAKYSIFEESAIKEADELISKIKEIKKKIEGKK